MAKTEAGVVNPSEILRSVRYRETLDEVDDTPRSGGILSTRRRQWAGNQSKERAVNQRVAINQEKAWCGGMRR